MSTGLISTHGVDCEMGHIPPITQQDLTHEHVLYRRDYAATKSLLMSTLKDVTCKVSMLTNGAQTADMDQKDGKPLHKPRWHDPLFPRDLAELKISKDPDIQVTSPHK